MASSTHPYVRRITLEPSERTQGNLTSLKRRVEKCTGSHGAQRLHDRPREAGQLGPKNQPWYTFDDAQGRRTYDEPSRKAPHPATIFRVLRGPVC